MASLHRWPLAGRLPLAGARAACSDVPSCAHPPAAAPAPKGPGNWPCCPSRRHGQHRSSDTCRTALLETGGPRSCKRGPLSGLHHRRGSATGTVAPRGAHPRHPAGVSHSAISYHQRGRAWYSLRGQGHCCCTFELPREFNGIASLSAPQLSNLICWTVGKLHHVEQSVQVACLLLLRLLRCSSCLTAL